ncbi:glycoside hydrolase family 3 protein [Archangium lipolyticum]|uniref:glycoside hydrolase family 3 protein n=1 Tax=Archangium lipolyticum TaxID=2970465 RepID=UPI00214A5E07|nr:exo 1,3/1,4-beta-D-glucan glucohydrolase [Archangium lipolyticum]
MTTPLRMTDFSPEEGPATAHPTLWPQTKSPAAMTDPQTEAQVEALLARLSVEEKVGQVIQGDINSIKPEDLRTYPLGSILAGGNSGPNGDDRASAAEWLRIAREFRAVSLEKRPGHTPIPVIFGVDSVHGNNNIPGATLFPHNIGLGAARDPDLIRRIGAITALESAVTGIDWTFGPTLAVPRDDRWGRTYEGYSEDPELVASYAGPMTLGLQGELRPGQPLARGHIAGSAKHFLGDGGTKGGKDQGDADLDEEELIRIHAAGYPPAINAGILSVMVSFSGWNGVKHTGNRSLLTEVLKNRMGFDGFVVGDWNAHGQLPGSTTENCPQAINAGLDMYMAPDSWKGLYTNTLAQVRSGEISLARLDDAVRRILRAKIKTGLFEAERPLEGKLELLGAPEHRAVAREAVARSLVLLKNEGVLPIKSSAHVLVAGDAADDIGKQCGGWTISWQGTGNTNSDFPNGHSIYAGIRDALKAGGGTAELSVDGSFTKKPDVAIVVYGENPYAEFQGDVATVEYQPAGKTDLALLKKLKAQGIPVVSVFLSGRPLWTNPEINASEAFVAAWLPGSQGEGVADVLIGDENGKPRRDFTGKLSFSWPKKAMQTPLNRGDANYDPQFPYGYGLSYAQPARVGMLSEDPGPTISASNTDLFFGSGKVATPWSLVLSEAGGSSPALMGNGETASRAVTVQVVDAGAQENGRTLTWSGTQQATAAIIGLPVDLVRQTNGDMAVAIRYRLDRAPTAPVMMTLTGGNRSASLDITKLLTQVPPKEFRTLKVKLSCFRDAGADMSSVTSPLALTTSGALALTFTELRLATNDNDAVCP